MKLTIEIDMDDAAFVDGPYTELEHILTTIKGKVFHQFDVGVDHLDDPLQDTNGNTVGTIKLTEETLQKGE